MEKLIKGCFFAFVTIVYVLLLWAIKVIFGISDVICVIGLIAFIPFLFSCVIMVIMLMINLGFQNRYPNEKISFIRMIKQQWRNKKASKGQD